jgi:hypothetical protein
LWPPEIKRTQFDEIVEVNSKRQQTRQVAAALGRGTLLANIVTRGFSFYQNKKLIARVDAMKIPCEKSDENLVRLCSIEDYIEGREKKTFLECLMPLQKKNCLIAK